MRYLLTFGYNGAKFHGFQRQNNVRNVQGELEKSLSKLLNENIEIKGSGRTDAGVHAIKQTAHFDTSKKLPHDFKKFLNAELDDIQIHKVKKVDENFHARFMIKEKTYRYLINLNRNNKNDEYYFTSLVNLNLKLMKEASHLFIGMHDFHNFVSGSRDDYRTYIFKITIRKKKDMIILEFTGAGFYRYMIRHLVGALYDVGRGKISSEVIKEMLDNPNKNKQLTVMNANGLYLVDVKY